MVNVHVIISFFVLFTYKEVLSAKLVTTKHIATDGQHYTWNFIFSGTSPDINFDGNQIIEDPNESNDAKDDNGGKLVPLDIDVRFGDAEIEDKDSQKSRCLLCPGEGGVYWREWNGIMPLDAIVGGHTTNQCGIQVPIYLAQALIIGGQAGLQPAQFFNYSKEIITSFEGIHKTSKAIKILCSRDSKAVVWMPYSRVSNLDADKVFVVAGFERDFNLFFGRANRFNEVIIGKVVHRNKVMYFPDNGKEGNEKNFEVLCYRKRLLEANITPDT